MLGSAEMIAFIASSDLKRSSAFYADTLGLPLLERGEYAHVFGAPGATLRVTAVPEVVLAGYTVLGWKVSDIHATVRALKESGVAFTRYDALPQDEHDVWSTPNGDQVAWFVDPDGHTLSLTQFA